MVGGIEGSGFDNGVIFLYSSYALPALKECVENKKKEGFTSLLIDIDSCEDCDTNYQTYKRIDEMISQLSETTGVSLRIKQ